MEDRITCLLVEPMKRPKKITMDNGLRNFQDKVGGLIDVVGMSPTVDLIINDEGKLMQLPFNRALRDADGEPYDIVAGTFLVVSHDDEGYFTSLSDEDMKEWNEYYKDPEVMFLINGRVAIVKKE